MRKVTLSSGAEGDRRVLDACWTVYAETALPPGITAHDFVLAREAFEGGARALYELLSGMQALAERLGDPPLDLSRVGRLLGWKGRAPTNE